MPKGPQGQKRPTDAIGLAVMIGKIATGEIEDVAEAIANSTGKSKGGVARARVLTSEQRSKIAKSAANSRWGKVLPEQETAE
jgi:hypothetical protein